ncbi:hypothetical protein KF707_08470 [Candidatus Obscuribacterales bacterium]|jgi:hypothetical protein|nr:hypothetical protein [Candidatus Obscuribacterales bacterium]MBX3136258.1 hypothetical protein [Candidatus Obscuribacterales bacterium]MBX3154211.1 hypothetical protein [Candidatus Obscuribacterales bacterium]
MAIQLNDRDHLIFNLIDEHEVLLEKHISWFITEEDKPVLIRDRLRKLFYLDYLLCHRHGTKLPWWTTPTKPLVYMLSPMAKSVSGKEQDDTDRFDANWQRHHLEVANIRMLYLIAKNEGKASDIKWSTVKGEDKAKFHLDAKVSFQCNGIAYDIGIANNPDCDDATLAGLEKSIVEAGCEMLLIVTRDDESQAALQAKIAQMSNSSLAKYCFFATHQELYKKGMISAQWQNAECRTLNLFPQTADNVTEGTFVPAAGVVPVTPHAITA